MDCLPLSLCLQHSCPYPTACFTCFSCPYTSHIFVVPQLTVLLFYIPPRWLTKMTLIPCPWCFILLQSVLKWVVGDTSKTVYPPGQNIIYREFMGKKKKKWDLTLPLWYNETKQKSASYAELQRLFTGDCMAAVSDRLLRKGQQPAGGMWTCASVTHWGKEGFCSLSGPLSSWPYLVMLDKSLCYSPQTSTDWCFYSYKGWVRESKRGSGKEHWQK